MYIHIYDYITMITNMWTTLPFMITYKSFMFGMQEFHTLGYLAKRADGATSLTDLALNAFPCCRSSSRCSMEEDR